MELIWDLVLGVWCLIRRPTLLSAEWAFSFFGSMLCYYAGLPAEISVSPVGFSSDPVNPSTQSSICLY